MQIRQAARMPRDRVCVMPLDDSWLMGLHKAVRGFDKPHRGHAACEFPAGTGTTIAWHSGARDVAPRHVWRHAKARESFPGRRCIPIPPPSPRLQAGREMPGCMQEMAGTGAPSLVKHQLLCEQHERCGCGKQQQRARVLHVLSVADLGKLPVRRLHAQVQPPPAV